MNHISDSAAAVLAIPKLVRLIMRHNGAAVPIYTEVTSRLEACNDPEARDALASAAERYGAKVPYDLDYGKLVTHLRRTLTNEQLIKVAGFIFLHVVVVEKRCQPNPNGASHTYH